MRWYRVLRELHTRGYNYVGREAYWSRGMRYQRIFQLEKYEVEKGAWSEKYQPEKIQT